MANNFGPEMIERLNKLEPHQKEAFLQAFHDINLKETIYMIESPSPEDLFKSRNEGDALARTLGLADIDVIYYLAASEEIFQSALDDVTFRINSDSDQYGMPFIHISAHGYEHGLELTDGGTIFWDQLTRKLKNVSDLVGVIPQGVSGTSGLPRINLSLSSCSAFTNYFKSIDGQCPVQAILGPIVDVEWCQSLIGFTTFFYQSFTLRFPFPVALKAMNIAAGGKESIFRLHSEVDLKELAGPGFDSLIERFRNEAPKALD